MAELTELIDALSRPELHGGHEVVVHQTHLSVVFVTGDRAYKLKKPVDFGFVDYSTVEKRREYCEAEVRLNRRLAAGVYLGVRPIVAVEDGFGIGEEDAADPVDWVVVMRRLDEDDNFLSHLHAGTLSPAWLAELGRQMARFHQSCGRAPQGEHGAFEAVAKNATDNFAQAVDQVGVTVASSVFESARELTERALERARAEVTRRDAAGATCDTHGDLRLEHVYRCDDELMVVDCIEFNDAFRYSDPIADIAFLVMDLRIRWAHDLADAFTEAYFDEVPEGRGLVDLYVAYRSAVRAKVHGMAAAEPELTAAAHERAFFKSRAHWLFTLSTLAEPRDRPALLIVGGLPGTGKSTLGRQLESELGFTAIDSDHVRKELAGVGATTDMKAASNEGIYSSEWNERTYAECLKRAEMIVEQGGRVAVSATFRDAAIRRQFLEAAHARGVRGAFLNCVLDRDEVARRLAARCDDASDADLSIHDYVAKNWDASDDFVARHTFDVDTREREATSLRAATVLRELGLT